MESSARPLPTDQNRPTPAEDPPTLAAAPTTREGDVPSIGQEEDALTLLAEVALSSGAFVAMSAAAEAAPAAELPAEASVAEAEVAEAEVSAAVEAAAAPEAPAVDADADADAEAEADAEDAAADEAPTVATVLEPLLTWEEGGRVWLGVPGDLSEDAVLARLSQTDVPGGVLWLSLGARPTTASEVGSLCERVGARVGRPVAGVRCMRGALAEGVRRAVGVAVEWEGDAPSETEGRGRQVLVVERTLRSGAAVRFRGDVLVYGDVNAGAEIEAGGNIIVLGALRGLAWAGNGGDETAMIISFDLQPVQLRIGKQIAFLPERSRLRSARGPESAVVRDGQIVLQEYRGRLSG